MYKICTASRVSKAVLASRVCECFELLWPILQLVLVAYIAARLSVHVLEGTCTVAASLPLDARARARLRTSATICGQLLLYQVPANPRRSNLASKSQFRTHMSPPNSALKRGALALNSQRGSDALQFQLSKLVCCCACLTHSAA